MRLTLAAAAALLVQSIPLAAALAAESGVADEAPRTLFLALDAVPYDIAIEVTAAPPESPRATRPFAHLRGPVPVISSFPSSTTVAFAGFFEPLGMPKPPGYEARFYDLELGRVRGGGPRSYGLIKFPWKEFFDWRVRSTVRKSVGFLRPVKASRKEIRRALKEFFASDRREFFAYIGATDGAGHLKGPAATARILHDLGAALEEARDRHPPHHTVVFSDHGMAGGKPLRNVRREVRRILKSDGFRLRRRVRGPDDLALISYGLLSSFVAFTHPGEEARAASLLASARGVALCASPSGEAAWDVFGNDGHARIERRPGTTESQWSYDIEEGDPLGYSQEIPGLAAGGFDNGKVWLDDSEWFRATLGGRYPDGLHRIARAFDLVNNPASVVCSVAPGYLFGALLTDWSGRLTGGRLRWTHGALDRADSLGFLMTDHPAWPELQALRFDTSLTHFVGPDAPAARATTAQTSHR